MALCYHAAFGLDVLEEKFIGTFLSSPHEL
jgi:hypothetical protein